MPHVAPNEVAGCQGRHEGELSGKHCSTHYTSQVGGICSGVLFMGPLHTQQLVGEGREGRGVNGSEEGASPETNFTFMSELA